MIGQLSQDALALLMGLLFLTIVGIIVVALVVILKQYKRCPPNRVLVIYGKTGSEKAARCVHGGACLVVPLFQDHAFLALEPIRVEISRQQTASGKTISDPLPRVFSVAIGTTPEMIETAAVRLLGLASDEIRQQAEDIIIARLDALIDAVDAGELKPGTDPFHQRLEDSIGPELGKLGLVLINFRRE